MSYLNILDSCCPVPINKLSGIDFYILVDVVTLLYTTRANIAPATPMIIPAGDRASLLPSRYSAAPPVYEPAIPKAIVFHSPKFSSPGTMFLAILPTNKP